MAIEQISAGAAPILWSTFDEAVKNINDNFTELALSVGGGGVVDLTALSSTIAPVDDNTYDLGKIDSRWRDIYLEQFIYLGQARISHLDGVINLPAGSTIGSNGQLLDENYFKTIAVSGQNNIIADQATDTLNLTTGVGVNILTDETTDTITFINSGVTSLLGSTGVSVSDSTGTITISNTGVTNLSGTAGEIGVSGSTGSITLNNLGVIELTTDPGSGIGLSASKGSINITNLAPNIAQNVFRFVSVPGQGIIEADNITDTLTLSPGYGINLTTAPLSDTLTVTLDQNIDINGSVFSDDSTLLVDGTNGTVPGTLTGSWNNTDSVFNVIGEGIGVATGSTSFLVSDSGINFANTDNSENISLLIGSGNFSISASGSATIALGGAVTAATGAVTWAVNGTASLASEDLSWAVNGPVTLAADNISIGPSGVDADLTGSVFADDSTLLVDGVDGKIVGPVDTTTVVASTSIESSIVEASDRILSPVIDSADSSAITVIPAVVFNSDVTVENDLIAGNIPGYVKLDTLKAEVADSVDFTDFQSRIAAL
jgi:hypothetical protein